MDLISPLSPASPQVEQVTIDYILDLQLFNPFLHIHIYYESTEMENHKGSIQMEEKYSRNEKRKLPHAVIKEVISINGKSHLTAESTSLHTEGSSSEGCSHPRDKTTQILGTQ